MKKIATCHKEVWCVGRVTRMLRGCWQLSDHFNMSRQFGVSLTCPQQVVHVRLMEFSSVHNKRSALPEQTTDHNYYKEVANFRSE